LTALESQGLTQKIQRRRRPTIPANPSNPSALGAGTGIPKYKLSTAAKFTPAGAG